MAEFDVQILGTGLVARIAAQTEADAVTIMIDRWRAMTGAPPRVHPPASVQFVRSLP
jgi:hypothetical protein